MTVATPVWARAVEIAELIGTTPNDVLAIFASKGMELADRQLATARRAAARVAAYEEGASSSAKGEMPTAAELDEAAGLLRRELDARE